MKKEEEKERIAEEEKHERRMLALNHWVGEGLQLTGGKGRRGRESSRRPGADSFLPVVDAPVIINDEFQQYMMFENLEVPQI